MKDKGTQFVVCVNNEGYPASAELRKLYKVIPDAAKHDHVDESGEDYSYPDNYFVPLNLPKAAADAVLHAGG